MILVSIDIGIINLGFVVAKITNNWGDIEPLEAKCIDLTQLRHIVVPRDECKLYHSNDLTDRIDHFIQENKNWFDCADIVLLERQPITGITSVEQLLFKAFRHKAILLSPTKMHIWLHVKHLDYEHRKVKTVETASPYLCDFKGWKIRKRRHDMADAFCFLMYYVEIQHKKYKLQQRKFLAPTGQDAFNFLDQFRCPLS